MKVNTEWIQHYKHEFADFAGSVRKFCIPIIFAYMILVPIIMIVAWFQLWLGLKNPDFMPSTSGSALLYAQMLSVIQIVRFISILSTLLLLSAWALFGFATFIITRLIVDGIYQLFFPEQLQFVRKRRRVFQVIKRNIQPRLKMLFIICMAVCALIYIFIIRIYELPIHRIIIAYIVSVIVFVPVVFIFFWSSYFAIYRKNRHKATMAAVLFSKNAICRSFKQITDALVWLALFGTLILPLLFASIDTIARNAERFLIAHYTYDVKWSYLVEHSENSAGIINNQIQSLVVEPSQLMSMLSPVGNVLSPSTLEEYLPKFQRGMFMIVLLGGVLQIGIPVGFVLFLGDGLVATLKVALLAAIKSTILTLFLKLLLSRGYFLESDHPLSITSVFFFSLSYFLAFQSLNSHTEQMPSR